jgi:hypothetical protein
MTDAGFIMLALVLFALSGLYVRGCARLTGASTAVPDRSDGDRS